MLDTNEDDNFLSNRNSNAKTDRDLSRFFQINRNQFYIFLYRIIGFVNFDNFRDIFYGQEIVPVKVQFLVVFEEKQNILQNNSVKIQTMTNFNLN